MTRYTPLRPKRIGPARRGRIADPQYLAWLRKQPCSVPYCKARYIEPAHVGPRGYGIRCHDRQAIPLCSGHHRLRADAQHVLGRRFWAHHGIVKLEVIERLNAAYEADRRAA